MVSTHEQTYESVGSIIVINRLSNELPTGVVWPCVVVEEKHHSFVSTFLVQHSRAWTGPGLGVRLDVSPPRRGGEDVYRENGGGSHYDSTQVSLIYERGLRFLFQTPHFHSGEPV